MATEIEHKFLVKNDSYKEMSISSWKIRQGYLCRDAERTVRVRIKDDRGFLTVKGVTQGASRSEFEYEVDLHDAELMLDMCLPPILEKTRYLVPYEGHVWEVDVFEGHRAGLVTAEIELKTESEKYTLPGFVGKDVTGVLEYYNSNL